MVRQLHDSMTPRVTDNGVVSEAFAMAKGVKHGHVLTPTLFSFVFSAILLDAYRDERPGIRVAYGTDDQLLNHWRMGFQPRVSATSAVDFSSPTTALSTSPQKGTCKETWTTSPPPPTTVVMQQPPPNALYNTSQFNVNGAQLQAVETYIYLAAPSLTTPKSTMKWLSAFAKPAKP
ncbi:hypothetical protein SprV_0100211200 [Sparganum proliferum]